MIAVSHFPLDVHVRVRSPFSIIVSRKSADRPFIPAHSWRMRGGETAFFSIKILKRMRKSILPPRYIARARRRRRRRYLANCLHGFQLGLASRANDLSLHNGHYIPLRMLSGGRPTVGECARIYTHDLSAKALVVN